MNTLYLIDGFAQFCRSYHAIRMCMTSPVTTEPFSWHTDAGVKHYRLGKFVQVSMTAMGRRGIKQSQAYSRRLTILHETVTGQESSSWPGKDKSHLRGNE